MPRRKPLSQQTAEAMLRAAPLPNHLLPLPGLTLCSFAPLAAMRVTGDTTPIVVGDGSDNAPRPLPKELQGIVVKPRVLRVAHTKGNHIFTPIGYKSPARRAKVEKPKRKAFMSDDLCKQLLQELMA